MSEPDFKKPARAKAAPVDLTKLDKLPPNSIEAEQGVLGCILLSPKECLGLCQEKSVESEWFFDLRHQSLFEQLLAMSAAQAPLDLISVQQHLKDHGLLEGIGGLTYLSGLMDAVPSAANLGYWLDILEEKHGLRVLEKTATQIISDIHWKEHKEPQEIIDGAMRDLWKLAKPAGRKNVKDLVRLCIDRIQDEFSGKVPHGIELGWPRFDRATGGLRLGEMFVIGARTSTGKTSCMVSIQCELLKAGHGVGVASIEIDDVAWMRKTISCLGKVDAMVVRELSEAQMKAISGACARLSKMPLEVMCGRSVTLEQVDSFAEKLADKGGKVMLVDYLQKFSNNTKKTTVDWASHCSGELSRIAQRRNIHLIVAAQLNREVTKAADRKPLLSDLKQSGSIEEDSDMVALLHRTNEPESPIAEINLDLAKNRNGSVDGSIPFLFHKRQSRFEPASPVPANPNE